MEVEAKFALPDAKALQRLQVVDHLAGFVLSAGQVKQMRDTYLDTVDRRILAAGYACRRRERDEAYGSPSRNLQALSAPSTGERSWRSCCRPASLPRHPRTGSTCLTANGLPAPCATGCAS